MALIELTNPIEGVPGRTYVAGAPSNGTNEVQTLTISNVTGGHFTITADQWTTANIAWSATNATLLANINTAVQALPNVGSGGWVATAGTLTAGLGTVLLTAGGNLAAFAIPYLMVANNVDLTGSSPTVVIAETTPGVTATGRGLTTGAEATDVTAGVLYINTGSATAPTWTKVGTQS